MKSEQEKEIVRLRGEIARRRRRQQNYDDLAFRLALLMDEFAAARGVRMTPAEKISSIRG